MICLYGSMFLKLFIFLLVESNVPFAFPIRRALELHPVSIWFVMFVFVITFHCRMIIILHPIFHKCYFIRLSVKKNVLSVMNQSQVMVWSLFITFPVKMSNLHFPLCFCLLLLQDLQVHCHLFHLFWMLTKALYSSFAEFIPTRLLFFLLIMDLMAMFVIYININPHFRIYHFTKIKNYFYKSIIEFNFSSKSFRRFSINSRIIFLVNSYSSVRSRILFYLRKFRILNSIISSSNLKAVRLGSNKYL
jgi:hypothetical protein